MILIAQASPPALPPSDPNSERPVLGVEANPWSLWLGPDVGYVWARSPESHVRENKKGVRLGGRLLLSTPFPGGAFQWGGGWSRDALKGTEPTLNRGPGDPATTRYTVNNDTTFLEFSPLFHLGAGWELGPTLQVGLRAVQGLSAKDNVRGTTLNTGAQLFWAPWGAPGLRFGFAPLMGFRYGGWSPVMTVASIQFGLPFEERSREVRDKRTVESREVVKEQVVEKVVVKKVKRDVSRFTLVSPSGGRGTASELRKDAQDFLGELRSGNVTWESIEVVCATGSDAATLATALAEKGPSAQPIVPAPSTSSPIGSGCALDFVNPSSESAFSKAVTRHRHKVRQP